MNFLKLEHMHAKFEHVCKTHTIAGKSVDMLFVKQEYSTIQACNNILENRVKPFAGGPAWECPGVAEQSPDLNPLLYSFFVLVKAFVLYSFNI